MMFVGAVLVNFAFRAVFGEGTELALDMLSGALVGLLGILMMSGASLLFWRYGLPRFNRGRKHSTGTAEELLARDHRPLVLYLRSFEEDAAGAEVTVKRFFAWTTEEEQFIEALGTIGPCVAIGRPDEPLPELGAGRLYVGNDGWREKVRDLMSRARLVVLRIGETEGLWWELREAREVLGPQQLILCVPNDRPRYARFQRKIRDHLGLDLPEFPRKQFFQMTGLVRFEANWEPHFVVISQPSFLRTSVRKPLTAATIGALRPIVERLGMPWAPPPINWSRVASLAAIAAMFLLFAWRLVATA
jgi:hypothetical protein